MTLQRVQNIHFPSHVLRNEKSQSLHGLTQYTKLVLLHKPTYRINVELHFLPYHKVICTYHLQDNQITITVAIEP